MATALGFSAVAHAALVSRLSGLAYYDTATNLTWLTDASYGYSSYYDNQDGTTDGRMTWYAAKNWAANLNVDGVTGWRLPDASPVNGSAYNLTTSYDGSTDVGYNISAPGSAHPASQASELAYLFYNTLGNTGGADTSGSSTSCGGFTSCLENQGPFINLSRYPSFWTESQPDSTRAFVFSMYSGYQKTTLSNYSNWVSAWAVHPGDVAAVPLPAAVWSFGSGMLGLVGAGTRRRG
ncbi:MAG: hypothetical protein P8124_08280 [Gammaproteobacteria bacterium]